MLLLYIYTHSPCHFISLFTGYSLNHMIFLVNGKNWHYLENVFVFLPFPDCTITIYNKPNTKVLVCLVHYGIIGS